MGERSSRTPNAFSINTLTDAKRLAATHPFPQGRLCPACVRFHEDRCSGAPQASRTVRPKAARSKSPPPPPPFPPPCKPGVALAGRRRAPLGPGVGHEWERAARGSGPGRRRQVAGAAGAGRGGRPQRGPGGAARLEAAEGRGGGCGSSLPLRSNPVCLAGAGREGRGGLPPTGGLLLRGSGMARSRGTGRVPGLGSPGPTGGSGPGAALRFCRVPAPAAGCGARESSRKFCRVRRRVAVADSFAVGVSFPGLASERNPSSCGPRSCGVLRSRFK